MRRHDVGDSVRWERLKALALRKLDSLEDAAGSLERSYPALVLGADIKLCAAGPPALVAFRRLRQHALDDLCRAEAAAASLGLPQLFAPADFPRARTHTTPPRAVRAIIADVLEFESDGRP